MAAPICIARIGAAHGVRGAVKLWTFTEDPFAVKAYGPLLTKDGSRSFEIATAREAKGHLVATLKGIATREDAERLNGIELYIARDKLPATDDNEYYHADLIGLAAVNAAQEPLGRVIAIHNFGAGDIIEIAPPRGATMLLPFTNAVVPTVDLKAGQVVIELPEEIDGDALLPMRTFERCGARLSSHCFPRCFRVRSASASPARRWRPGCGRWRRGIFAPRPPTAIAASMIPRPAAAPAWCSGPTCWLMPSTRRKRLQRPQTTGRPRLLMSPQGRPLTQSRVMELAAGPGPLIVCGRFEGIDQRVIEARRLEEVSLGDYVLSGGEIAAMALIDACVRLLPGVMGKLASGADESFSDGLLEYPQYTRPQEFEGRPIPEILLSGDHAKVAAWRQAEAEALTRARRPDLWAVKTSRQKPPKSPTDG